jgi:hypothetical protein
MAKLYVNNAYTTLSANCNAGATSMTVTNGSFIPAVTAPDVLYLTLENAGGTKEIIKVTAHTAASVTLTIVKNQESTGDNNWLSGDTVEQRITAGELTAFITAGELTAFAENGANADITSLTALASINGGPMSGLRNPVTNFGFQIDTRNEAAAQNITATLTKCFDNWSVMAGAAVSGTLTVAQGSPTAGAAQSGKSAVLLRSSGSYTNDFRMVHIIPTADAQKYAGRTIKVGLKVQAGSAWLGGSIKMDIFTGTGSNQGSASMVAGTWTTTASTTPIDTAITTSLVEYTGNAVIPAGTTEIGVRLRTSAFTGGGSGNDYAVITDVFVDQLDARSAEVERILCGQRCRLIAGGIFGRVEAATKTDCAMQVEPPMAAAPTASVLGTIRLRNVTTGLYTTATTPSLSGAPLANGGYIEVGAASFSTALVAGDLTALACDAAKSGILLSAEL